MRITNSMMVTTFLNNMNNNMLKMDKYNNQLSTGKKISRLSDDTVGVISSLTARSRLNAYKQYQENLVDARNWVDQAETAIGEINSMMTTIRENVVYAATDVKNDVDKANIGRLVSEFKDHIFQSGNVTMGNMYLFGGFNTTSTPFTKDANGKIFYNGLDLTDTSPTNVAKIDAEKSQKMEFEIGFNLMMDVTFTGPEIMGTGENNIFKVLGDLENDLANGAGAEVLTNYLDKIDNIQANLLDKMVSVGARSNKLDNLEDRYAQDVINYTAIKSNIEDADPAEVIMNFKMAEAVYRQSLSVGARIIQPTLMDYLR